MRRFARNENAQAAVEFALIALVFFAMTVGLADAGKAFYFYNAEAAAARFAARWGSVVGGTCGVTGAQVTSENDWCNQFNTQSSTFWNQSGNQPLQSAGNSCPSTLSSTFDSYYYSDFQSNGTTSNPASQQVSTYANGSPTIVGAVVDRLDTNTALSNINAGVLAPGFDKTKLRVCIELTAINGAWHTKPGDRVTVYLYYPYTLFSSFLPGRSFNLVASSQFVIE